MFLIISWSRNWNIRQADVTSIARIYATAPRSQTENPGQLKASIYGLKQSGKVGFRTIHISLRQLGFQASVNGGGVYYLEMSGNTILLIVYVDDLAYSSNTEELTKWFEKELAAKFQIKCAELIIKFIGLELKQEKDILWLHQEGKILEMAQEYNMNQDEATNIVTPIIANPVILTGDKVEIRKLQNIVR
eukprot:snap_masked-scaffold_112-processed-gene-0.7-mRNA-1 protein AED:0.35 eAED:0.53 QI:0/0/0/0.66/1/1/3/0/189